MPTSDSKPSAGTLHGFTSLVDYLKAMVSFTVLMIGTLWGGMTFVLDTRYVQDVQLNSAVQTIQKGLVNDRITDLEVQIQVVRRKLDATSNPDTKRQLEDELRVLTDAKSKAERDRQEILQDLNGA